MSDDRAARPEAELSVRRPTLETFVSHLAEIVADADQPITAQSHLIEDLKFEGLAFSRLGLLLYTHYGIGGLSPASLSENLTVESFFEHCVLNMVGVGLERPALCRSRSSVQ